MLKTNDRNGDSPNGKVIVSPPTIPDRLEPNNVEAEQAVIGSLLIDPDAIMRVSSTLEGSDFWVRRLGFIYDVVESLYADSVAPDDLLTVSDRLRQRGQLEEIGGGAYLSELINSTPSSIHVEHYAQIVKAASCKREMAGIAGEIARLAYRDDVTAGEVLDQAEQMIFGVRSNGNGRGGAEHIRKSLDRYYDRIEYLSNNKNTIAGLSTGLADLDKLLGGLQRSDMIVIAGRPGMGKTSLAISIALHLQSTHHRQKHVAVFSLEMSAEQLTQRLISAKAGIDSQRLRLGDIKEDEWLTLLQATKSLSESAIYIDDTPALSIFELRSEARRLQAEHGIDLLIVDYMQLMSVDGKTENRQQEISLISRSIKALARELNIPILSLSQLSRECEKRNDKRPILSDLRESGTIEQDADVVLFIYRDELYNADTEYPNVAEINVCKHRSGPTGVFSVYFRKHLTQFRDLEKNTQSLEQIPGNIERQYAGDR